eukprot:CAMPEP_0178391152 /NCGR_PEP_ID=MMETSP0689_2-20121128/11016_1 /TAXON_ID=160604 /ORGANISM="Amphidinium massartii, Strain CS-259" /LENGTH=326 /DNA_ID=CAMNT_0020011687 /DNA_START=74 /DNA_END=1051 /DNA_ORIENTATION=-
MAKAVASKKGVGTKMPKKKAASKGDADQNGETSDAGKVAETPLPREEAIALLEQNGFPPASQAVATSKVLLSPLQVHFSQSHIRPEFQDGTLVAETKEQVKATLCPPLAAEEAYVGAPTSGNWWLLSTPFANVEAIQWQCKLREEDGTIKMNEDGEELYSDKEWYSLDNRRLYCLQSAAAKLWPDEVRCVVSVVQQHEGSWREFRKFRTLDCGRSVAIGHRYSADLPKWSWRKEVGLPEETPLEGKVLARPRKQAKKAFASTSGNSRPRRTPLSDSEDDDEDEGSPQRRLLQNFLFFLVIYTGMRLLVHLVQKIALGEEDANQTAL